MHSKASPSPSKRPSSKRPPSKRPQSQGARSHEVRIIGGQWKRTKLKVADKPGLRPTPDRVRETLFNWLGQDLRGQRCVDAFAGTGALGFEAASRGAPDVLLIERDGALVEQLEKTKAQLTAQAIRIQRGDGLVALGQQPPASCDVIFLDPPFDAPLQAPALQAIARVLSPAGFIYVESPQAWTDAMLAPCNLVLCRYLKAGAVHAHLLQHAQHVLQHAPS